METNNEYLITEEEFKTLDTDNISEIVLNNGTILKFNKNKNICTCKKNKTISKHSNSSIKEKNKFSTFTNKKEFYVMPIPNAKPKLIAIKLPEYQEQKEIKYNIKTFTFESEPKKYKYKPYKPPKRKHTSRINNQGCPYICTCTSTSTCTCTCNCTCPDKNRLYCTCRKYY